MNIIVCDETGDYYVIPEAKKAEWRSFIEVDIFNDDWDGVYPEWATYVGGHCDCIKFEHWEQR